MASRRPLAGDAGTARTRLRGFVAARPSIANLHVRLAVNQWLKTKRDRCRDFTSPEILALDTLILPKKIARASQRPLTDEVGNQVFPTAGDDAR